MGKSINNDENLRGQKFGRLTIIGFEKIKKPYGSTTTSTWNWICRCECGNIVSVIPGLVKNGHTTSCGCYKREKTIEYNKKAKVKHGGRSDRLYYIWRGMKERCYNKNNKNYPQWGGRGISICDEWINDYAVFRAWALKNGYDDSLSLDRIDVNSNYSPENCRWATYKEQARNKTNAVLLEYNGVKKPLAEWADDLGINYGTLYRRIFFDGWSVDRALSEPLHRNRWL